MAKPVMNAGTDVVLNYSAISGGPTTHGLTGGAIVTAPGSAISTWLWELIEKPTGSSATLSSTSAQNPTLNNIDLVGTYRLFLRGTDDAAQESESDILLAPSSAFCTISVRSQYAGLQKPAPTQRDWHDEYYELVDEVDSLRNDVDTHAADTSDPHETLSNNGSVSVTNAPAGSGEMLVTTSATEAEWTAVSAGLVPVAETGVLGSVKLTEAPFDSLNPKAVTRDKIIMTQRISGTLKIGGFLPFEVSVPVMAIGAPGPSPYRAVFHCPYNMYIDNVWFMFEDGGSTSGQYSLSVFDVSPTQYANNAAGTLMGGVNIAISGVGDGYPTYGVANTNYSIAAGQFIGIAITVAPTVPGGNMTVQICAYQEF